MHTPRLCIDARAAVEFPATGWIAAEVIDQLVSSQGELESLSCDWMERRRTVVLSHPKQLLAGQLRRFETARKIRKNPMAWAWNLAFPGKAQVSALHRFLPVDRIFPQPPCPSVTTVLPAEGKIFWPGKAPPDQWYVVPSAADKLQLKGHYSIPDSQIIIEPSSWRRAFLFTTATPSEQRNTVIVIGAESSLAFPEKNVLPNFMGMKISRLTLREALSLPLQRWRDKLTEAAAVLYLPYCPFDLGTLALESFLAGVPTFFSSQHAALKARVVKPEFWLENLAREKRGLDVFTLSTSRMRAELVRDAKDQNLPVASGYRRIYQNIKVTFE